MWLPLLAQSAGALQVEMTSTANLRGVSPADAFTLVSTPSNWASLAVGSHRVSGEALTEPLVAGVAVEELAGAPPLLPLEIVWVCRTADWTADAEAGILTLESEGVAGLLTDCKRVAQVKATESGCAVELSLSYTSSGSALAVLIDPLVVMDNSVTTQLLLPSVAAGSALPAKQILVWGVLIGAWATSSVGWMTAMEVGV